MTREPSTALEEQLRSAFAATDQALRQIQDQQGGVTPAPPSAAPAAGTGTTHALTPDVVDVAPRHHGVSRRALRAAPILSAAAVVAIAVAVVVAVRHTNSAPAAGHAPAASSTSSQQTERPAPSDTATAATPGTVTLHPGPQLVTARIAPSGRGLALTENALLATSDRGASWTDVTPSSASRAGLQHADIRVGDRGQELLAVPAALSATGTSGPPVTVYRRNGDTSWQQAPVTVPALPQLPGAQYAAWISATGSDAWLAISEQATATPAGALLHSSDGGATWTTTASGAALPAVGPVAFLSGSTGYITSVTTGRVWQTRDGGTQWTPLTLPAPAGQSSAIATVIAPPQRSGSVVVAAASYASATNGDASGVALYRSIDGGTTWTSVWVPATSPTDSWQYAAAPSSDVQVLLANEAVRNSSPTQWRVSTYSAGSRTSTHTAAVSAAAEELATTDRTHLWALASNSSCASGKSDCASTIGLLVSADEGASWKQASLPG